VRNPIICLQQYITEVFMSTKYHWTKIQHNFDLLFLFFVTDSELDHGYGWPAFPGFDIYPVPKCGSSYRRISVILPVIKFSFIFTAAWVGNALLLCITRLEHMILKSRTFKNADDILGFVHSSIPRVSVSWSLRLWWSWR
jgi:hypothetical protein